MNMTDLKTGARLRFKEKVYTINPDFRLLREIEHELGSLAKVHERFTQMSWEISDLVTLTHMMLQSAGETVDYLHLGNLMLKEGLRHYLSSAQSFLNLALYAE
jgi:hypothetical protein